MTDETTTGREGVIQRALGTWAGKVHELRPDLTLTDWTNECLDMAGLPRLRSEERYVLTRETEAE